MDASEIDGADGLTEAIRALVGADGVVNVESPVAEFDRVVHITPRAASAVALDMMIGHDDEDAMPGEHGLVVISARRPSIGWWTFDDLNSDDGHWAAWSVLKQIVDHGGAVDLKRADCCLT